MDRQKAALVVMGVRPEEVAKKRLCQNTKPYEKIAKAAAKLAALDEEEVLLEVFGHADFAQGGARKPAPEFEQLASRQRFVAIPRRVAPQQSPLPLHQSPTILAQSRSSEAITFTARDAVQVALVVPVANGSVISTLRRRQPAGARSKCHPSANYR
jgi:hypothetical protein